MSYQLHTAETKLAKTKVYQKMQMLGWKIIKVLFVRLISGMDKYGELAKTIVSAAAFFCAYCIGCIRCFNGWCNCTKTGWNEIPQLHESKQRKYEMYLRDNPMARQTFF